MTSLELLRRLTDAGVDFIVVGGLAATFHGSSVVTEDLDVCVRFDLETMRRLQRALDGLDARERMSPHRPPMADEPQHYVGYRNLYLVTTAGVLDLLGELTGVGGHSALDPNAIAVDLGGVRVRVMSLDDLITSKRALGRPKDLRVVAELSLLKKSNKQS